MAAAVSSVGSRLSGWRPSDLQHSYSRNNMQAYSFHSFGMEQTIGLKHKRLMFSFQVEELSNLSARRHAGNARRSRCFQRVLLCALRNDISPPPKTSGIDHRRERILVILLQQALCLFPGAAKDVTTYATGSPR